MGVSKLIKVLGLIIGLLAFGAGFFCGDVFKVGEMTFNTALAATVWVAGFFAALSVYAFGELLYQQCRASDYLEDISNKLAKLTVPSQQVNSEENILTSPSQKIPGKALKIK